MIEPSTAILWAAFFGIVAGFFLNRLIDRRLCEKCGAKALPNQTRALIAEARRADRMEDTLLLIANSSATHTAPLRALAWEVLRETER